LAKSGEKIVKDYIESKGLHAEKIPKASTKSVDFAVYSAGELVFYLEEKTIEPHPMAWKNVNTVYNAIGKHIYEATKQFKSTNSGREVPNVLALINRDPARSIDDLFTTLIGYVITPRGRMQRIDVMKKLEKEEPVIDLFLWFDQNQLAGHILDEDHTSYEAKLTEVLGLEQTDGDEWY